MATWKTRMARGERGVVPELPQKPAPLTECSRCARRDARLVRFAGLGELLRGHRTAAGVKQGQLSLQSGVLQSVISKIEHGKLRPGEQTILLLASALHLDADATDGLFEAAGYEAARRAS